MVDSSFRLTAGHVESFFQASKDANPLHRDAHYAHRTPFGRPVAYGMAATLLALSRWAPTSPRRLVRLRCEFRKPLFVDEDYGFSVTGEQDQRLRIGRGGIDYVVVSVRSAPWDGTSDGAPGENVCFEPRTEACGEPLTAGRHADYRVDPAALALLQRSIGLAPGQLPAHQLVTLLWLSYCVGMEMPGRQALFADAQVEFADQPPGGTTLSLQIDPARFDERFNRYTLQASGPGITRLQLSAFQRPPPVDVMASGPPGFSPGELPLQGRTALVTGAARGFGAVLALTCAHAGAAVIIHHRGPESVVKPLRARIEAMGGKVSTVSVDLEGLSAGEALQSQVLAAGLPDLIVSSAASAIPEARLFEQDDADILRFISRNLTITLNTARPLLPHLPAGAQFVQVSTRYLSEAVPGFPHYLAAKAAQEGLMQALAQEFRNVEFIVARLPRMLTDQTNTPFSTQRLSSPGGLAVALVRTLAADRGKGYRLLEVASETVPLHAAP